MKKDNLIFIHRLIKAFADSIIIVFIPLYILKQTNDINLAMLYLITYSLFVIFLMFILKKFIQKYGVFFKEAYVFIDGLIDENNIIRGVTIGDDQYHSYPFIPFDPSILPVSLSKYGDFIWNAYVMPESVLNITNNEYPDFVFSNPIKDWTFSTKPLPGNLRQLVEQ